MDNATHGDGDWKEHASVLFYDIKAYMFRMSVLKMWALILSSVSLMQV